VQETNSFVTISALATSTADI